LFRETADLLEIENANVFRIRAYRSAARSIEELSEPIGRLVREAPERLRELPGIGADLAGKIEEIVRTGSLRALRELERKAPRGAVNLMHVPGIGPRRARVLSEHGIRTLPALEKAARTGKLKELPGFGEVSEQNMLRQLAKPEVMAEPRTPRPTAARYAESLLEHLRSAEGVEAIEVAGSYRRRKDTVGDLDILVASRRGEPVIEHFLRSPGAVEVLAKGPTRSAIRLRSGLQVDLRVLSPDSFGAGLQYFTGSKAHGIALRRLAVARGLKLNEYGVWRGSRRIAGASEEGVYRALGLPWIPPELREDRGEIEAARKSALPRLIELGDVRGDLQSHTTDSDGRDSLNDMARAAEELGHEYLAVTDHTPSVRVAGGMNRTGFLSQMRRIDRLNARLRSLTVLKGAEVDIHRDGTLDLDDGTLAALDIVLVSLHSHFDLPEREQTRRVLRALEHPSVDVLAHPSGRAIGHRPPVDLDWDAVFHAARSRGILLEVNAQPERLDLDDVLCQAALAKGVKITIATDAHDVSELGFLQWGVDQARRGWARKADVVNTLPLAKLLRRLHRQRG
jgi:DNA polymerase (family 10)